MWTWIVTELHCLCIEKIISMFIYFIIYDIFTFCPWFENNLLVHRSILCYQFLYRDE